MNTISHPHDDDAERAVLASLMCDPEAWPIAADIVTARDFYRPQHRLVFDTMTALADADEPLDAITVTGALQSRALLDRAGGREAVESLADVNATTGNVGAHARIVRECALQRRLLAAGKDIVGQALAPEGRPITDLIGDAERRIVAVAETAGRSPITSQDIAGLVDDALENLLKRQDAPGGVTGLPSGFVDLDGMTTGLQPSTLVIVAGRPAMGKTALAMNMVARSVLAGTPALVFSMEMTALELTNRLFASEAKVDLQAMLAGQMTPDDWKRVRAAAETLREAPLRIETAGNLTAAQVRSRARQFARVHGTLGLIVVDYLQLMSSGSDRPGETRAAEVTQISRALKAVAIDMACPVIALAQLNRNLEHRASKRPVMADLRESGSIEQDADLILFIYRDEVYVDDSADAGTAEIIVGKQRNGPIGSVTLAFLGRHLRFENLARSTCSTQERPTRHDGEVFLGFDGEVA